MYRAKRTEARKSTPEETAEVASLPRSVVWKMAKEAIHTKSAENIGARVLTRSGTGVHQLIGIGI